MYMRHYLMLSRNLLYTGLTRAKKLAILVGYWVVGEGVGAVYVGESTVMSIIQDKKIGHCHERYPNHYD